MSEPLMCETFDHGSFCGAPFGAMPCATGATGATALGPAPGPCGAPLTIITGGFGVTTTSWSVCSTGPWSGSAKAGAAIIRAGRTAAVVARRRKAFMVSL
jgi:hypothetical protein